jgi:hypothetical protein
MISMNSKSSIRGMDADFVDGNIFITTFDGYVYHYRMNPSNPSVRKELKN